MKFLCIDSGLYLELCNALSDKGKHTVYYYTNTGLAFPRFQDIATGNKFEYVTKVQSFWKYVDEVDVVCNFDVGANDAIDYIRKKYPDKSVFGAGQAEKLEMNRLGFKKTLEALDLPCIPYKVIKGMDALRKYLETHPKQVVKADSSIRGDFETLKCDDYKSVKQILDDRAPLLGLYAEECQFIVEDMVECKSESGYDGFFSNGVYIPFSYGIEYDKNLYIGKVIKTEDDVPEVLMETLDAFRPVLDKFGYRGALSTEERIVSEKEHYFIDPCCRGPLPLGVLYSRFINNWPDLVYSIGKGEPIEVDCDYKYVGAFALCTTNTKEHFTLVQMEEGHRDDFRFMMACQNEKKDYYAVKGQEASVVVVAGGDSPEDVIKKLKKNAEYVHAFGLENDAIKSIDGILEKIKEAEEVGIDF